MNTHYLHLSYDVNEKTILRKFNNSHDNARKYILATFKNREFKLIHYPCETTLIFKITTNNPLWLEDLKKHFKDIISPNFSYIFTNIEKDNTDEPIGFYSQNDNLEYTDLIIFFKNLSREDINNYLIFKF